MALSADHANRPVLVFLGGKEGTDVEPLSRHPQHLQVTPSPQTDTVMVLVSALGWPIGAAGLINEAKQLGPRWPL